MNADQQFDIFLVSVPGLEAVLCREASEKGFKAATQVKGGVTVTGAWSEVLRANLELRGASRILVRIGEFRAMHLAQLDKRARRVPWGDFLRPDVPVHVEASCKSSRIYHEKAATERIAKAIHEELGAPLSKDADIAIKARILDDLCTISIDTSGESLHKRGHKQAVNKAPLRETMAALFLRQCGFDGSQPVVDPMCGAGTIVIEAAEMAAGLFPGRTRRFAFEQLANFDQSAWQEMRNRNRGTVPSARYYGFDRDAGAIEMCRANAQRAGVDAFTEFARQPISDLCPPDGPPGLVIINPPYGGRIGNAKSLFPLYNALGQTLAHRFSGWKVGLVTNMAPLAKATALPFSETSGPISHGGLSVRLYTTDPL